MRNFADFATDAWPLRISALNKLVWCPGMVILEDDSVTGDSDESGIAAQNGTAIGRGIELYHLGADVRGAVERLRIEAKEGTDRGPDRPRGHSFPMFEAAVVEYWLMRYAADPRNPREAAVSAMFEYPLRLEIPAAPEDPTGKPIVLLGHCDQVRRCPRTGRYKMWDVKSGKGTGIEMLYQHAWQLAGYTTASDPVLGEPVDPGGIIRMRGYDATKTPPELCAVFFEAPYTRDDLRDMLDAVATHVALVRSGLVLTHPGRHCQWCAGDGPQNCGRLLRSLVERGALA